MNKKSVRSFIKEKLNGINTDEQERKSTAIRNRLAGLSSFQTARNSFRLMTYLSFENEVQLAPDEFGFPIIVPFCDKMEIVPYRIFSRDELQSGVFGILEPNQVIRALPERRIVPQEIDFVLIPGLAFDLQRNRLGRGKGFYDRFLSQLSLAATTAALAFECQILDQIPCEPHDQPVSIIVTEDRII